MDCKEQDVLTFLSQPSRYKIPIYQRRYSWDNPQWVQLFNDILAIEERKKHFLGSVVLSSPVSVAAYVTHQYVIDGQQRIVTISILLKAIYDLASSLNSQDDYAVCQRVMDSNLIHLHDDTDNRFRVQPVGDDFLDYKILFNSDGQEGSSRIARCYRFFRDQLRKKFIDKGKGLANFTFSLHNLYFLVLVLHPEDDAQVIFESINATGLALTESDKIRNFILMKASPEQQLHYYRKYWEKIEENSGDELNHFIRYYLMTKDSPNPRIKTLYEDFKKFWAEVTDKEATLGEMLRYSEIYRSITVPLAYPYDPRNELSRILFRLTSSKLLRIVSPLLLKAIDYCKQEGKEQEIVEVLLTIESFVVRRLICQIGKNVDTNLFRPLHRRVLQIANEKQIGYNEALKIALLRNKRTSRYPSDKEFYEKFTSFELYTSIPKEVQRYILARLESGNSREGESHRDVLEKLEAGQYSIEHIMPRKLSPEWEQELGNGALEVHEKYIHTLGNITLTAYNSNYSNRTFAEKKAMGNGFNSSPLRLNAMLKTTNRWNATAIVARAEQLFKIALTLWPRSGDAQQSSGVEDRPLNLYDDFAFTALKGYEYKGVPANGDSWNAALEGLLDRLKEAHPDNVLLAEISQSKWRRDIDKNDTNSKIKAVKRLFRSCGLDERNLIFYVEQKGEYDDDINPLDFSPTLEDGDDEDGFDESVVPYIAAPREK